MLLEEIRELAEMEGARRDDAAEDIMGDEE